jgi:cell division protein FtsL
VVNARSLWVAVALTAGVVGSGIGVVYSKYLSRKHFVQLQTLRAERDQADIRWGRLQLEESALATFSRIEADARAKLEMRIPRSGEVMVLGRW